MKIILTLWTCVAAFNRSTNGEGQTKPPACLNDEYWDAAKTSCIPCTECGKGAAADKKFTSRLCSDFKDTFCCGRATEMAITDENGIERCEDRQGEIINHTPSPPADYTSYSIWLSALLVVLLVVVCIGGWCLRRRRQRRHPRRELNTFTTVQTDNINNNDADVTLKQEDQV